MLTVVAIYQIFTQPTVHNTARYVQYTRNIITEWKALLFDELDDNYGIYFIEMKRTLIHDQILRKHFAMEDGS